MDNLLNDLVDFFKILVSISIFYVWVPRQDNIRKEFQDYNYPDWLRDLTGIFKLTFAMMLFYEDLVLYASAGLVILMLGAFGTHMRVKNGPRWFMPSLSQIVMNGYIFYMTY